MFLVRSPRFPGFSGVPGFRWALPGSLGSLVFSGRPGFIGFLGTPRKFLRLLAATSSSLGSLIYLGSLGLLGFLDPSVLWFPLVIFNFESNFNVSPQLATLILWFHSFRGFILLPSWLL